MTNAKFVPYAFFSVLAFYQVSALGKAIEATVLDVDPAQQTMTIRVDGEKTKRIASVEPGDLRVGYEGEPIRAELRKEGGSEQLSKIWPNRPVDNSVAKATNRQLHRETIELGRKAFRDVGDYLPDYALYDQTGTLLRGRSFQGSPIVINFIFTRCQVPEMCPASNAKMTGLARMAKEAGLEEARFLTFTFDPEYDTPGVLNQYASQRGADLERQHYLTGDPEAIRDLMKQFGILTYQEDGTIVHNSRTILADRRGRVVYFETGAGWKPSNFLERLKELKEQRQ